MSYKFQSLAQLVDQREELPNRGNLSKRKTPLKNLIRVWHHSLTKKSMSGSTALGFARYHTQSLGWERIGYTFVLEPQNIIDTPKGKRARIVYANDIHDRSYHVGESNDFSLGICIAGDYRYEELDEATLASIVELHDMLEADNIGSLDKSHHEMKGYSWKACCVFDYHKALNFLVHTPVDDKLPEYHVLQFGDTLWGLANNDDRFTVEDLMKWNNLSAADAGKLKVGQKIYFKQQSVKSTQPKPKPAPKVLWTGFVKVDNLNVRKGASVDYPTVKQLEKNDEVKVYEEKNGWLNVGNGQWISNVKGAYVSKKPISNDKYLNLRPHMETWRVYKLNSPIVAGREVGKLAPKRFRGISYKVIGNPQKDVYTIQTQSFGKVNIFAPRDNDSTITSHPLYK